MTLTICNWWTHIPMKWHQILNCQLAWKQKDNWQKMWRHFKREHGCTMLQQKIMTNLHMLVGLWDCNLPKNVTFGVFMMAVARRTQVEKTAIKGIIINLCWVFKKLLAVITIGTNESIDLHMKLTHLSHGTSVNEKHIIIATSKVDGLRSKWKKTK